MKRRTVLAAWFSLSPWKKILIALVLGMIVGLGLSPIAIYLKPIGMLFINAIHMMVTPVVFTAIVCAVLSVTDLTQLSRVAWQALLVYALSMMVAALIGIFVAHIVQPGVGFHPMLTEASLAPTGHAPSFIQLFENLIPRSPLGALVHEQVLQMVVFALILGFSIRLAGKQASIINDFFQGLSAVVFKLAGLVISCAPYGIFALIAWTFASFGWQALLPLAKFVFAVYLGCIIQILLVYVLLLSAVSRLNPIRFFKGIAAAMILAFTTSSSAATLPLSMKCAEENLGVPPSLARFLLPLGSSFNLNGLSIYLSVAVVFAANIYGVHLGISQYVTLIVTTVLTAMGAAAVPGSALIVMGAVMSATGVPLGALALIAGVDRLNDMAQTTTNVTGDLFSATFLANQNKHLDRSRWEGAEVGEVDSAPEASSENPLS